MKDDIKNGIIATKLLENLSEDDKDLIIEQAQETKPSRIKQTKNFRKRENKKKYKKFEDDDYLD